MLQKSDVQIMRIKRYADLTSHHECVGKKALLANSCVPTNKQVSGSINCFQLKKYARCYHLSLNQCLTLHPNCQYYCRQFTVTVTLFTQESQLLMCGTSLSNKTLKMCFLDFKSHQLHVISHTPYVNIKDY